MALGLQAKAQHGNRHNHHKETLNFPHGVVPSFFSVSGPPSVANHLKIPGGVSRFCLQPQDSRM